MAERLSRWGVGPRIALPTLLCGAAAGLATHLWPQACLLRIVPGVVLVTVAIVFFVAGLSMLLTAVISMNRAYNSDQLVSSGVFALVRHPIYSSWIVLILPGIALFSRSWPLLLLPAVAYIAFKLTIHREDEYLQQQFGQAYLDYQSRVNELLPFPRSSPR